MPIQNPQFWKTFFWVKFNPQIDTIKRSLERKILPAFKDIEREADNLEDKEFERLSEELSGDENGDMSELVERAKDKAVGYYSLMTEMKSETLHIFYVLLYKVFDQQFSYFYQKEILDPREEHNLKLKKWSIVYNRFKKSGITLRSMSTYQKINILRLISNVIKHGDGPAAKELKKLAPHYFNHSNNGFYSVFISDDIRDDLNLSLDDFKIHAENVKSFWYELGNAI